MCTQLILNTRSRKMLACMGKQTSLGARELAGEPRAVRHGRWALALVSCSFA